MISKQQDMVIDSDDQERIQATNDTYEPVFPYDCATTKLTDDTLVQHYLSQTNVDADILAERAAG